MLKQSVFQHARAFCLSAAVLDACGGRFLSGRRHRRGARLHGRVHHGERVSDRVNAQDPRHPTAKYSDIVQLNLLCFGADIGACQHGIAARDDGLDRVLPGFGISLDIWLAIYGDLRGSRAVRRLWDERALTLPATLGQARSSLGDPITT